MKILWLCNTLIPEIAQRLDISTAKPESWITGLYHQISACKDIFVYYLFPTKNGDECLETQKAVFIGYKQKNPLKFEKTQVEYFESVLQKYSPDVIHIFGTEYCHAYAMMKACTVLGLENRTAVSIQGLVSICAKHYFAYIPERFVHRYSFRDFIRKNNIYNGKKDFAARGEYEIETIKMAKHIIGRTDWDYACTKRLHPDVQYHFCNETLRPAFYKNAWKLENCERYTIFVSQSSYPIKGMHLMLEAMADIVKRYPNAHLYTTGKNPLTLSFNERIRQTYYNKYLGKLIKKYSLQNKVTFLGYLNEEQMCDRYLKTHVFVSPSSIENSPNSLGEAMSLGVPSISSDVGGVKNLLEHGKEGFVYQADAPYMLAYYVMQIFENDGLALELSQNAKRHALELYDRKNNLNQLFNIYKLLDGNCYEQYCE